VRVVVFSLMFHEDLDETTVYEDALSSQEALLCREE